MRLIGYLILAVAAAASMSARGQTMTSGGGGMPYVPPPIPYSGGYSSYGWGSSSTTPVEGFRRGLAEVIRAQGEYNLATSAAAVNFSEARRREIDNDKLAVQTYFELRETNRQQRDAEIKRQRGNPEDFVRYAQAGKPKQLSSQQLDAVTGQIHWPVLLTGAEFDQQRAALEKVFAARAYHGILGAEEFLNAVHVIDEMSTSLAQRIQTLPAQEFVQAKSFLRSLAYEARLPAG